MQSNKLLILVLTSLIILFGAQITRADFATVVPGDVDGNGVANIGDAVFLIGYIFGGGQPPENFSAADVNNDCVTNIADVVDLLEYIFVPNQGPLTLGCQHQEKNSGCLSSPVESADDPGNGYMVLNVMGNDLHIYHIDAYYQCCLGYAVDYRIDGFEITATESDTGDLCDCYCLFTLESVLYDLEDGEYAVCLIGIDDDTVGIETIIIGGGPGMTGYHASGCLDTPADAATFEDPDIVYSYCCGILSFAHHNAFFNCAAYFLVDFEMAGDTLRFYELNVSNIYVYCMCYFEITAQAADIPPGSYVAEVYEHQYPYEDINLVDRRTIQLE